MSDQTPEAQAEAIVRENTVAQCETCTHTVRDARTLTASIASALRAERAAGKASLEKVEAQLRGWRDFFNGQREMPYRGSDGAAKESQLNFAWRLGYPSLGQSDLWKLMVSRADRAAAQSDATYAAAFAAGEAAERGTCQWAIDDYGGDSMWETQCGHAFEFTDGGPAANGARFCCYCGKRLVEAYSSEDPERNPDTPTPEHQP